MYSRADVRVPVPSGQSHKMSSSSTLEQENKSLSYNQLPLILDFALHCEDPLNYMESSFLPVPLILHRSP